LNPLERRNQETGPHDPIAYPPPSLVGKIVYACLPLRQNTVVSNLQLAFGDRLTEAEIRQLARAFYAHFIRSFWEFFALALTPSATRAKLVRIENPEIFFTALEARRGLILLGGHTGSWSVTLTAAILQYPDLRDRISILLRPFRPAWLQRIFWERFRRAGINILEKRRSMNTILRRLAANQVVGFVMDQHASPREGVRVNFFGRPAWTFRSLAVVARRSGAPVVPVAVWREGAGHVFRLERPIAPIVTPDLEHDIRANTQLYNDALERIIRRHPEQWIWNHRRWKNA
jgi:Kdo2-lipid IVA lauroyltransferase/acyltransferase